MDTPYQLFRDTYTDPSGSSPDEIPGAPVHNVMPGDTLPTVYGLPPSDVMMVIQ
ncbi:hypothetical protein KIPB_013083, partial [Kipferlia bialata]|eukprot:g13083.t1